MTNRMKKANPLRTYIIRPVGDTDKVYKAKIKATSLDAACKIYAKMLDLNDAVAKYLVVKVRYKTGGGDIATTISTVALA